MSVFKAYDIRGIYNKDFNKDDVYKIGFFLPRLLNIKTIYVGRDSRLSSPEVFKAFTDGITDAGTDVVNLGLCTTPAVYFATAFYNAECGVQITASHNPQEYNGLKISKAKAIPVGGETGLKDLEKMVLTEKIEKAPVAGKITEKDLKNDYITFLSKYVSNLSGMNVGIDFSNGMAALYVHDLLKGAGAQLHYINETIDGSFPGHEPNPLEPENCEQIKALVKGRKLDVGVIYDGDADRAMFIDEKGEFIRPDVVTAVLAAALGLQSGDHVLVDIRTSRAVVEYLENTMGANVTMWKVGHAFAKLKLKEINAVVGGELAGHYYFRDFFNCDSGILASLLFLTTCAQLKAQGRTISQLIKSIDVYANSQEINFTVENKAEAIEAAREYAKAADDLQITLDFDGLRFEYDSWWFNIRSSNTEPYLRLVMEAQTSALLEQRLAEIKKVLAPFVQK